MNECKYNFSICVCVRFLFASDLRQDIQRYEAVLSALLTVWRVDTDSKAMCRFAVSNFKYHSNPHVQLILITLVLLLLLLLWRYNSVRVLAFSTISFHLRRSCTCSAHFISFIFFISFLTSSRLGFSNWSSSEWFPFLYSFYYASFGHSIFVSKPTQSLGFNIIYYVPMFN